MILPTLLGTPGRWSTALTEVNNLLWRNILHRTTHELRIASNHLPKGGHARELISNGRQLD